jgi:hypothetical protein
MKPVKELGRKGTPPLLTGGRESLIIPTQRTMIQRSWERLTEFAEQGAPTTDYSGGWEANSRGPGSSLLCRLNLAKSQDEPESLRAEVNPFASLAQSGTQS